MLGCLTLKEDGQKWKETSLVAGNEMDSVPFPFLTFAV